MPLIENKIWRAGSDDILDVDLRRSYLIGSSGEVF